MKKNLSLSLILVSSLFLSACGVKDNNSSTKTDSPKENSPKSSFSIRDLIAQNIPQKCTWSGQNEDGSFTTEMVISGKKFNQVITFRSAEGEEKINSISDGEYVYTWGNHSTGGTFATKLKADFSENATNTPEIKDNAEAIGNLSETQTDLDSKFEGDCSPTIVTDANFQPPKDVKFEDYSKFLDDLKSSIPSIDATDLE